MSRNIDISTEALLPFLVNQDSNSDIENKTSSYLETNGPLQMKSFGLRSWWKNEAGIAEKI